MKVRGQVPRAAYMWPRGGKNTRTPQDTGQSQLVASFSCVIFLDTFITGMGKIHESLEMNIDQIQKVTPDSVEVRLAGRAYI